MVGSEWAMAVKLLPRASHFPLRIEFVNFVRDMADLFEIPEFGFVTGQKIPITRVQAHVPFAGHCYFLIKR
jgi:hypothetical protein